MFSVDNHYFVWLIHLRILVVELPPCLDSHSFRVKFEILRVFLQAGIPVAEINFPAPNVLDNYDQLWRFLQGLPVLQGKPLAEQSAKEAWDAACDDFSKGGLAVVLSGSLRFNESTDPTDPLFRFRLKPMKLDRSHRLGRRLGNDRFLEIEMPNLDGNHIPSAIEKLGDKGRQILFKWLVDGPHRVLGRSWQPFYSKKKESNAKSGKREKKKDLSETAHCVYFFAVSGSGLRDSREYPDEPFRRRTMSVKSLLDTVRPTRKNMHQSDLKLFARTALGNILLFSFSIRC